MYKKPSNLQETHTVQEIRQKRIYEGWRNSRKYERNSSRRNAKNWTIKFSTICALSSLSGQRKWRRPNWNSWKNKSSRMKGISSWSMRKMPGWSRSIKKVYKKKQKYWRLLRGLDKRWGWERQATIKSYWLYLPVCMRRTPLWSSLWGKWVRRCGRWRAR